MGGGPRAMSASFSISSGLCFRPLAPRCIAGVIRTRGPSNTVIRFNNRATVGLAGALGSLKIAVLNASTSRISTTRSERHFSRVLRCYSVREPGKRAIFAMGRTLSTTRSLNCPMLMEPDCILNNRNVRVTTDSSSVERFVNVVAHAVPSLSRRPILMSGCLVNRRIRISTVYSNGGVLVPNVVRRVSHTNVRSNSSVSICPTIALSRGIRGAVISCAGHLTSTLRIVNVVGVRFVILGRRICVVRMGPHSSEAMPCVDGMANVPTVTLTAETVLNRGLSSVNCNANLFEGDKCCTVGLPMFSFRGVVNTSASLNPRVGSANRILNVSRSCGRTLLGTFSNKKISLPGSNGVVIAIHSGSGTRIYRVLGTFGSSRFGFCTAPKAHGTLLRTNVSTGPMGGLAKRDPGVVSVLRSNSISLVVGAPARNEHPSESNFGLHQVTIRDNASYLASLSTTGTLVRDAFVIPDSGVSLASVTALGVAPGMG